MYYSYTAAVKIVRPHYVADGMIYTERVDALLATVAHNWDYPPTIDYMVDYCRALYATEQATAELASYGVEAMEVMKACALYRKAWGEAA